MDFENLGAFDDSVLARGRHVIVDLPNFPCDVEALYREAATGTFPIRFAGCRVIWAGERVAARRMKHTGPPVAEQRPGACVALSWLSPAL